MFTSTASDARIAMAAQKADDAVVGDVSLVQRMLSATTGSILTSLLGKPRLQSLLHVFQCLLVPL